MSMSSSHGSGEIGNMRDGWNPHVSRARKAADEWVASLQQWAAAIQDAPVDPSVHDAANEVVGAAAKVAAKVDEVNALTRQADAVSWGHAEQTANRPNRQNW